MGKPTPTPWFLADYRTINSGDYVIRSVPNNVDDEHPVVASVQNRPGGKHNAKFIVLAVNSHAELLAACETILNDPDIKNTFETATNRTGIYADTSIGEFNEWCIRTAAIYKQLKTAVAKAKGEVAR